MNRNLFFGLCAVLVGLALVVVGLQVLLESAEYQATVRIEIQMDIDSGAEDYNPYFLETELNTIKGDVVLSNVVRALNLDVEWGKHYANGGTSGVDDTVELLGRRIKIDADRGTRLVEISVTDENPYEAARIANAIAGAYADYRVEVHRRQMEAGIEVFEKRYREEAANITQMEASIERLEEDSSATNSDLPDEILHMKGKLRDQENLHKMLGEKIDEVKAVTPMPKTALVTIVEPAVPPTIPTGPNRWSGALCLVCGLVIAGYGFILFCTGARRGNPV